MILVSINPCLDCIVFIHFYSASHSKSFSEALPTTAMTLFRNLNAEALQETVSEGLAQGPYVAAGAGFEPTTLRSKGIDFANALPRPIDSCWMRPWPGWALAWTGPCLNGSLPGWAVAWMGPCVASAFRRR